jgi:hypothetical protein
MCFSSASTLRGGLQRRNRTPPASTSGILGRVGHHYNEQRDPSSSRLVTVARGASRRTPGRSLTGYPSQRESSGKRRSRTPLSTSDDPLLIVPNAVRT